MKKYDCRKKDGHDYENISYLLKDDKSYQLFYCQRCRKTKIVTRTLAAIFKLEYSQGIIDYIVNNDLSKPVFGGYEQESIPVILEKK